MNNTSTMLQRLTVILAVTAGSYGLAAPAQAASADAQASVSASSTSTVGEKIDQGVQTTKRVTRKTVDFVKEAGHDAADATRRTSKKIAEKIPGTDANARVKAEAAAEAGVKQQ